MSLMDRYIAEVGRHLPERDRSDIEAEIRSMIEDMLEERGHNAASAGDKTIAEILEGLGDPKSLAFQYAPPKRYLIGPDWYEGYIKVLQRVLFTALPVFAVVTFILRLTEDPLDFMNAVGEAVGGAFNVGVQILFWVTLVFVFLERSDEKPGELSKPGTQKWTIAQLPEMHRKRQIGIAETLMNVAVNLFLLLWIALPFAIGRFQGDPGPVQVLHPNLSSFWLPLFFVLAGLSLVHEVFKLKVGNWTPVLTVANVILGILWIVYIAALVTTQEVLDPLFLSVLDNASGARNLRETVEWSINISTAIIVGIYVWDMVNSIRLARQLEQNTYHGHVYGSNVRRRMK